MSKNFRMADYLRRIGFGDTVKSDYATFAAMHLAHVNSIPFEGLDPLIGRPVKLDIDSVQTKLLDCRRGGYCFEHNMLFKAALEDMGFKVTGLAARVRWMSPPNSPLGPKEHMLLKVDLPEGAFLADVGFGACLMDSPIPLVTNVDHSTAMGTFRISEEGGLFWLSAKQPSGWRTAYAFDLEPQISSDYELGNWYTSTSPHVPFTSMVIMERLMGDRRYKLVSNRFVVEGRDGFVSEERVIDNAAEFGQILDKTFDIETPIPVEELFAKFGA